MNEVRILYRLTDADSGIFNFARQRMSRDNREGYHTHDFIKIMRITEGSADWSVDGVTYLLTEGDIILLNSNESRRVERVHTPYLGMDWIQFTPMAVYPMLNCTAVFYRRPQSFKNVVNRNNPHYEEISAGFCHLARNAVGESYLQKEAMVSGLQSLLIEVTRCYRSELDGDDGFSDSFCSEQNFRIVTEALSYIREHFAEPLSEGLIAQRFYISCSYFSRLFKAYYGIGFSQYLRRLRLEHTLSLLKETDRTDFNILDAALACGFSSSSAFYKTVRECTGSGNVRSLIGKNG